MVNRFYYESIEFSVSKKDYSNKQKDNASLMFFAMKVIWFVLFIHQIKNLKIMWIYC